MILRGKLLLFLGLCAVFEGAHGEGDLGAQQTDRDNLYRHAEVLAEVSEWVLNKYVDEVDPDVLFHNALRGMVESLDPHSTLLSPEELKRLREEATGAFGGIGVILANREKRLTILAVEAEGPAGKAGLKAGDRILEIDGRPVQGFNVDRAVASIRGEPGTTVHLKTLGASGDNARSVSVVRERIEARSVREPLWIDRKQGLCLLRVTSFQRETAREIRAALLSLLAQGLKGLVLDLRNNPGGVFESAVETADLFLRKGVMVRTEGRAAEANQVFRATPDDSLPDFPMVILVNEGSASAAEVLAGILKVRDRAILLGTSTFGKRRVQSLVLLEDGWALKMTSARYIFPGEEPEGAGRLPVDIPAEVGGGEEALRKAAVKALLAREK
ncbi:MAG: S41 family peptidase [Planctomycetota bacterium]|jgi:carboxyl-terminal processing protease